MTTTSPTPRRAAQEDDHPSLIVPPGQLQLPIEALMIEQHDEASA